jgi:hypothetical protein
MSLVAFKNKSVIQYGSKRSGKPVDKYWVNQGPYGLPGTTNSVSLIAGTIPFGPGGTPGLRAGFSVRGSYSNTGGIGKTWKFSKNRTPFRGEYPIGSGGVGGRYTQSVVLAVCPGGALVKGDTSEYVKAVGLSTKSMISQRYRWINSGQYPNYWVQPNYGTSNLSDNTSQGLYIHTKSAANDCVVDTNAYEKYIGHVVSCGSTGCQTTPARGYKMVVQQGIAPYTKNLYIPQDSSQHTLRIQQRCANPTRAQKPNPPPTNGDVCGGSNQVILPI